MRCRIDNIDYNFMRKKCVVIYLPLFAALCLLFDTLLNGSVFSLNFDILKCALEHALFMEMFKVEKENKKKLYAKNNEHRIDRNVNKYQAKRWKTFT